MEVSGQFHTPAALPPWEGSLGTHWILGGVGARLGQNDVKSRSILNL
jgi:hypothetical protein